MGGAPYSSAACANCKKRKIKCDLQKPECGRCSRRGISCPGYPGKPFKPSIWQLVYQSQRENTPLHNRHISFPGVVPCGPEARVQISSSFIRNYFSANLTGAIAVEPSYHILSNLLGLANKSAMLENAISALSCVYLGKIKHDEFMIRYGIELYNKAISQLARMLSQNSVNVETLYATIVFQTLEAIYCSYGLRAWISHAEATGKLFQRFHKSLTGSPIEQAIYDHQKLALIYSAATASDFTRNYNRVLHTQLVSPLDEIFELYVGISSLINEVNRVAFSDNKAAQRILAACLAQREKISQWYVQRGHILGQYPSSYSADSLSHTAPSSIDLFGLPYNFVNLDTARLYILYWTTCLLAELLVYKVSASMISPRDGRQRANAEIRELRNTEQCLIAESYADEICRCLQYCLQPETNACGVHIIVASLNHVYKPYALLRRREKFQWCQDAFKAISNRGLALASILSHAGRDVWHFHEGSNGPQSTQIPLQDTIEPPLIPNKDDSVKLLLLQMGKGRRTIE